MDRITTHHDTSPSWHALAHGISHDGANIAGAAQLAAESLQQHGADPVVWDVLADSLARTHAFLQRIRGWAEGDPGTPHTIALAEWLPAVARDVEHMATASHAVQVTLNGPLGTIRIDGERYSTAVRALVTNAIEAMPDGGAVRVYIETTPTQLSTAVVDEGPGLSLPDAEATQPYTTTKPGHKGLGLADVVALARGYDGRFQMASTTEGTTTQLTLSVDMAEHDAATSSTGDGADRRAILFVDDETTLLRVATRMLERSGYTCHVAPTVEAAIACFDAHNEAIGLAVVDYLLPDGTGTDLIYHFRQTHPDLPVILASGISHGELHQHAADAHADGILSKPYRSGDLLHAVQAVLPAAPLTLATI